MVLRGKRITVTVADIAEANAALGKGLPRSQSCPVAIAARRSLRRRHVIVVASMIFVGDARGRCACEFGSPWEATKFVMDFDAGRGVKPFSFRLGEGRASSARYEDIFFEGA
jgi:hypothetical protein